MNIKDQAYQLHKSGLSYKQISNKLEISKTRAYEYVKEMKLLNANTSNKSVQNGSEPEKCYNSERVKDIVPNDNEIISENIIKSAEEISVPASSELQKNDSSEHENMHQSEPENNTEKLDINIQEVKTLSGDDLVNKKFNTYDFSGSKFFDLIGCPEKRFYGLVFGLPKSGKSFFCIFFADYMQEYHCDVLYAAAEEGISLTLQKKFKKINGSKVTVLPTRDREVIRKYINTGKWPFVLIDSINNSGIDSDYLELIKSENPTISIVVICQATKAGNFKGEQSLTHNCDFIIEVVAGVAKHTGRFGCNSEVNIFDEPLYEKNNYSVDFNQPENYINEIEIDLPSQEEPQPVSEPNIINTSLDINDLPDVICSTDLVKLKFPESSVITDKSKFTMPHKLDIGLLKREEYKPVIYKHKPFKPKKIKKGKPLETLLLYSGAAICGHFVSKWLNKKINLK